MNYFKTSFQALGITTIDAMNYLAECFIPYLKGPLFLEEDETTKISIPDKDRTSCSSADSKKSEESTDSILPFIDMLPIIEPPLDIINRVIETEIEMMPETIVPHEEDRLSTISPVT